MTANSAKRSMVTIRMFPRRSRCGFGRNMVRSPVSGRCTGCGLPVVRQLGLWWGRHSCLPSLADGGRQECLPHQTETLPGVPPGHMLNFQVFCRAIFVLLSHTRIVIWIDFTRTASGMALGLFGTKLFQF